MTEEKPDTLPTVHRDADGPYMESPDITAHIFKTKRVKAGTRHKPYRVRVDEMDAWYWRNHSNPCVDSDALRRGVDVLNQLQAAVDAQS